MIVHYTLFIQYCICIQVAVGVTYCFTLCQKINQTNPSLELMQLYCICPAFAYNNIIWPRNQTYTLAFVP